MTRFLLPSLALFLASTAAAQDVIQYRDRSARPEKPGSATGNILSESFAGIKIKLGTGGDREISAGDITDVTYVAPGAVNLDYKSAVSKEAEARKAGSGSPAGRKAMDEAEKLYVSVVSKLKDPKTANLQRHLEYKIVAAHAFLADDKDKVDDVIAQLDKFRKAHPTSWHTVPATRHQVQLLIDREKYDPAAKIYEELLKNPDLAKDVKQEFEFASIELLMRARNFTAADARVTALLGQLPKDDPQAERLKFYQIGCKASTADLKTVEPQLKGMIETAADPTLKALGYNTLGDCYMAKGQPKDAKWAYLWVDAVYNQDRNELLKALERLSVVFKALNDEDHSEKCKEKLARLK